MFRILQLQSLVRLTQTQEHFYLQGNLIVEVTITFIIDRQQGTYFLMRRIDLGMPLVSKLKLYQPAVNFQPARREPIEQMEDTDSSTSMELNK